MSSPPPAQSAVSLVIPTRDTRELTLRCLESIRSQAGVAAEVVVVDDASRDGTAEAVAARFPEARLLRNEAPGGFTASINRGLETARGDVLVALNSDTELLPGALEALLARFAEHPRLGVAGGRLVYPDGSPQWSGGGAPGPFWLFGLASGLPALLARIPGWRRLRPVAGTRASATVDWVTGAALAMRREVWEQVGPFDARYRFYAQDLDLCLKARSHGWAIEVVPGFGVVHHHGATVGKRHGAVECQDPELLWTDLARWLLHGRRGASARRALRALRLGARLRVFGRDLRALTLPAGVREAWRRDTLAYRKALGTLSTLASGRDGTEPPELRR